MSMVFVVALIFVASRVRAVVPANATSSKPSGNGNIAGQHQRRVGAEHDRRVQRLAALFLGFVVVKAAALLNLPVHPRCGLVVELHSIDTNDCSFAICGCRVINQGKRDEAAAVLSGQHLNDGQRRPGPAMVSTITCWHRRAVDTPRGRYDMKPCRKRSRLRDASSTTLGGFRLFRKRQPAVRPRSSGMHAERPSRYDLKRAEEVDGQRETVEPFHPIEDQRRALFKANDSLRDLRRSS